MMILCEACEVHMVDTDNDYSDLAGGNRLWMCDACWARIRRRAEEMARERQEGLLK